MATKQSPNRGPNPLPSAEKNRRPEDVIAAALADEDLMRQVRESLEEERRGEPATPFRQILKEAKRRRSA